MAGKLGRRATPGLFDEPGAPESAALEPAGAGDYAEVALDKPVARDFTYSVPRGAAVQPGVRVIVPFGSKRETGVVVSVGKPPDFDPRKVKAILRVLDREPAIEPELLELARRIAAHYACSRGQVLAAMLPALLRSERERRTETWAVLRDSDPAALADMEAKQPKRHRLLRVLRESGGALSLSDLLRATGLSSSPAKTLRKLGAVAFEERPLAADPLLVTSGAAAAAAPDSPPELTDEQSAAVDAIADAAVARRFQTFLLFGVTGSGKTEVYLRALERARAAGRGGIVLVPEISLTPQTVQRFRARFGEVAVLHSRLTDGERAAQWQAIRERRARIVVGARSAIFAPVADLGLIVVDEEHEPSFKQGNAPRYHARDVAIVRGQLAGAAVVLGSATPSLETWRKAQEGSFRTLRLTRRVAGGTLPPVHVADLRGEAVRGVGAAVPLTRPLKDAMHRALDKKQRVILFLNRRGFSPALWCRACGATVRCARCSASLTYHRRIRRMVCHLCHEETPVPRVCPSCGVAAVRHLGAGTERIEQVVLGLFPKAHVGRMDADATIARGSHEQILDRFRSGEIDVLVGTQMIAKGLDVPEVTVVGVVDADASLHIPEFNASERTFQLVAQVAGRAGRSASGGEVIVQTSAPDHPAIRCAVRHDFESFAALELEQRRRFGYPPFARLVRVLVEAKSGAAAERAIDAAAKPFRELPRGRVELLGPQPAPIETIRGRSRWHFLLRCTPPEAIASIRDRLRELASRPLPGGVRPVVDVDPVSTL